MPYVMAEIAVQTRLPQFVAIDASGHGNILFLPERIPLLHGAMAHRTFRAGDDVLLMAEEGQVWKLVHWRPGKKAVAFLELGQFLDCRAVGLDALMAGPTFRDPGDRHLAVDLRSFMARTTFHSRLNMLPMTERHRLSNRVGGSGDVLRFASRARGNRPWLSLEIHPWGSFSLGEQGVGRQNSWGSGVRIEISTRSHCDHHKLLFCFLAKVGDGGGVRVGFELVYPKFFSRARIEGPKAVIGGTADEDKSARGGD